MQIRDPGWKKVGSRIRDKHPGSATLLLIPILGASAVSAEPGCGLPGEPWRLLGRAHRVPPPGQNRPGLTFLKGLCHEMNNFLKVLKVKSVLYV
jgi:hypothetical protein